MIELSLTLPKKPLQNASSFFSKHMMLFSAIFFTFVSIAAFMYFSKIGLTLAYNDARSHLDIGRRVVEGLKPGLAQLGSVWLPLPHVLMIPTIWNDYMWHSGLSGSIQSMISFVSTALLIRLFLKKMKVDKVGQIVGMLVFAFNLNILYLQSTAMTELLLMGVMTAVCYEFLNYTENGDILTLLKTAFWVMLSTLIRYDGWFLLFYTTLLVVILAWKKKGIKMSEGMFVLYCTLAGFGVFLWLLWNAAIFKDPLYFAFGPYSAHAQQEQIAAAGQLITQHNWMISLQTYWYAMSYNTITVVVILGLLAGLFLFVDKKYSWKKKLAWSTLFVPFVFNVLALYLGHSVLFIQGINGNSWFNVRYGVMMVPSVAIFLGYLTYRFKLLRPFLIGLLIVLYALQFANFDSVTIDDGRVGSSQKNVTEVSGWLSKHVANEQGFVLISAASHDAIIFSSGLPMKRFINEGTGTYWLNATTAPDRWARWIVMRTNDDNDQTSKLVRKSGQLYKYNLVESYPFADVYELKSEYLPTLNTKASLGKQK